MFIKGFRRHSIKRSSLSKLQKDSAHLRVELETPCGQVIEKYMFPKNALGRVTFWLIEHLKQRYPHNSVQSCIKRGLLSRRGLRPDQA